MARTNPTTQPGRFMKFDPTVSTGIPFVAAVLPSLIDLVPKLGKIFSSGSEPAERDIKASEIVVGGAKEAIGARNEQELMETIKLDAKAAVCVAIEAQWFRLEEVGGGITAAREPTQPTCSQMHPGSGSTRVLGVCRRPADAADDPDGHAVRTSGCVQRHAPHPDSGITSMLMRAVAKVNEAREARAQSPMETFGFRDLKGKGATDMWLNGTPIEQIQLLCGQSDKSTTEKYIKARWNATAEPNGILFVDAKTTAVNY